MNNAKVDLHLHLDGSLNTVWAYKKALQRNVIEKDCSYEDFYNMLFTNNNADNKTTFSKFDLTCALLQEYEDLYEATYDLCKRLNDQGLIYAEIRYASQQHTKKGLTQLDSLKAVINGANKAMEDFPIKVGIINCFMHKGDSAKFNHNENLETLECSKQMYGKGLVGMDIAGYENNCALLDYKYLFDLVKQEGIPFTVHAAEMGIGSHIMDALSFKPNRIGHGIDCIQDESYLKAVVDSQIPLEVCVTSNIKNTMNYASHPIRKLLTAGCNVTINTDNMMFALTSLENEYDQLRMIGISDDVIQQCKINSIKAAFCDENLKKQLLEKI